MAERSHHFDRGKEARAHGLPREIQDGRMSSESRQDWYDGWDEQNRYMQPKPTDEQRKDHAAFCDKLLDLLK